MNETDNKELPKCDFAFVASIDHVNAKPHPPMIGPRHVAYASDHCGGMLTAEAFDRAGGCDWQDYAGARRCGLKMAEHTSDKVAFIKLTRDASHAEAHAWIKELAGADETHDHEHPLPDAFATVNKLDGFAFIDTGFRILPPEPGDRCAQAAQTTEAEAEATDNG